jgi:anti-sigma B factor antagonist
MTSPAGLRAHLDRDAERATVRVVGELDLASVDTVEHLLDEAVEAGCSTVVLELRGVTFCDSTGLRLLIRQTARADRDGVALRIEIADGGAVHRLLELTGLMEPLRIAPGEGEAVRR